MSIPQASVQDLFLHWQDGYSSPFLWGRIYLDARGCLIYGDLYNSSYSVGIIYGCLCRIIGLHKQPTPTPLFEINPIGICTMFALVGWIGFSIFVGSYLFGCL